MKKSTFKLFVAIALVVGMIGLSMAPTVIAGGILEKIVKEGKLNVGVAPWVGLIKFDPKTNRYEGLIADDLRHFTEETGIEIVYHETTWSGMIAGLQARKWDAIMNGLGATVERSKAVAFTEPYGYYCEVALIRSDSDIKSFKDLDKQGNIATVVAGTSAHSLWKKKMKNAKLTPFSDSTSGILEVIQGRANAYMSDLLVNTVRAKERPELKLFIPENTVWFYEAHCVRYEDQDLLSFLNTYIRNMKVRGWYKELAKKHDFPPQWVTGPSD